LPDFFVKRQTMDKKQVNRWFEEDTSVCTTEKKPFRKAKLSLLSLPKKKKKTGGNEVEKYGYIVIRNDGGPTHIFKQYNNVSSGKTIELKNLTSARYVVPESAVLLARSETSDQIEELDISLDGPLYKPLDPNEITLVGQRAEVLVPDQAQPVLVGRILGISDLHASEPIVDLVLEKTKQKVRTKFISIKQLSTWDDNWDQELQTISVPVSPNIKTLYLNYQTKANTFDWKPKYRALIHPNFQSLLSFRCTATVSNKTEEILKTHQLRLRLMRKPEYQTFEYHAESLLRQSALPTMALMQSEESTTEGTEQPEMKMLQEFITHLPNNELLPKKSCRIVLFEMTEVPILSWYEFDIDIHENSQDKMNLSSVTPRWKLRIENKRDLKKKPAVMNWPAGPIQLLLTEPPQVSWLKHTHLPPVPYGDSKTIELTSPWDVSAKVYNNVKKMLIPLTEMHIQQLEDYDSSSARLQLYKYTANILIELRNNETMVTKFPIRLRLNTSNYQNCEMIGKPGWSNFNLQGIQNTSVADHSFRIEQDGAYWIISMSPLPARFLQVFQITVSWTELATISISESRMKRLGGKEKEEEGTAETSLDILPVPVPSDDEEDEDNPTGNDDE
jgi:hypothetical protein